MSKLILSKFKKSLGQSSNIISDSRISNSFHNEINMLESIERAPQAERQYIDKSSLNNTYRNSHDHNKLIKKIPLLISENDQLKDKVKKLEEQLEIIFQRQKKKTSFSFGEESLKQDQNNVNTSIYKRTSYTAYPKSNKYSLDYRLSRSKNKYKTPQNHRSRFEKDNSIEEFDYLKETISELELEVGKLKQQNKALKEDNDKLSQIKMDNAKQIEKMMNKFEQTINHKEELSKSQTDLYQLRLAKIKIDLQTHLKEKNMYVQECQRLRRQFEAHLKRQNSIYKMDQANLEHERQQIKIKTIQAYKLNETIQHLWKVKDTQINNMRAILAVLNPKTS